MVHGNLVNICFHLICESLSESFRLFPLWPELRKAADFHGEQQHVCVMRLGNPKAAIIIPLKGLSSYINPQKYRRE